MILDFINRERADGKRSIFAEAKYPTKKAADYSKNSIYLGKGSHLLWTGKKWKEYPKDYQYMNVSTSDVILRYGKRGSGKTLGVRSFYGRAYKSDYHVVILNDIKNESLSNNQAQEHFLDTFAPNEYPQAIPTTLFIPAFLAKNYQKIPDNCCLWQIPLSSLKKKDFMDIMQFRSEKPTEADVGRMLFQEIESGHIKDLHALKRYVERNVNDQMVDKVTTKIDNLINEGVIGDNHNPDIIDYMNKGHIVGIGLEHSEDGDDFYISLYVALLIRIIRRARKRHILNPREEKNVLKKPIIFVADEAHTLIPKKTSLPSKTELLRVINKDRSLGFTVDIATQYPSQIPHESDDPENIVGQVTHFLIPGNSDPDNLKLVLRMCGIYKSVDHVYGKWQKFAKMMKTSSYLWAYINRDDPKIIKIKTAWPLMAHTTEKR